MKVYRYIFAILIAILPMLWIDNYTIHNSIWWTVVLAWHLGVWFGYMDND